MSTSPDSEPSPWQVEDVRGVWTVSTVGGRVAPRLCGFCGEHFESTGWVQLSVARPSFGGTVIDLCPVCTSASWESIATHLALVTEQLRLADAFRAQVGF